MNLLKRIWAFLDGKKTIIGVVIHFIASGLKGINAIDDNVFKVLEELANFIMLGGVVHRGIKAM